MFFNEFSKKEDENQHKKGLLFRLFFITLPFCLGYEYIKGSLYVAF